MRKKSKGGKRVGAGRPPLADTKVNIPLRVAESDVKKWGGKDELKKKLYDFIAFPSKVGSVSFVEFPLFTPEAHNKAKSNVINDLTKAAAALHTKEQPISKFEQVFAKDAILKEIEAIKAQKCPPERSGTKLGRDSWQMDQQKRIQELQNKLNGI